jgi:cell division protein FtsX
LPPPGAGMSGRFKLLVSEAWRSLGANLSTTVAATMTVLIGMFLLGLFIALGTWTVSWSNHVKRQLVVKVYFYPNATAAQKNAVGMKLEQNPYVKPDGIKYVSKAQGLEIMKKRYLQVAHVIEAVFTIATAILLVASVLLIANTIRLSIFSRRREIEVMKLVGATNWFVRGPFMLEGLFCGLFGSILAVVFLTLGKVVALPAISPHLSGDADVKALSFTATALILLAMGLGLGAVGSGLTIRRFLRV